MYTSVNPSFTIYNWGLRETKLYRRAFVMLKRQQLSPLANKIAKSFMCTALQEYKLHTWCIIIIHQTTLLYYFLLKVVWSCKFFEATFRLLVQSGSDIEVAATNKQRTSLKSKLTVKAPRKTASENVVCLCRLLHLLANFSNLNFAYKQTVWTQIRLLLKEQSDLGSHCLQ